ncbi:MAG: tetratricopeptide repeat protein [Motiliproteus sp.]
MKRLVLIGLVAVLSACAGQPNPNVPVEEKGFGAPQPAYPTPSHQSSPQQSSSDTSPAPAYQGADLDRSNASARTSTQSKSPVSVPPVNSSSAAPSVSSTAPPSTRHYDGPPPALLALMEQADRYESQGNQQAALAQLERAQRIAPRDPMVYLQLARLRLHMNDRARAEQLARRGLSLSAGDPELTEAFNALLKELSRG